VKQSKSNQILDIVETADPRWKDLYRIGGITSITLAILVIIAVIAFFIWPYKPSLTSTINVFTTLQNDRLGGLIALDLPFIVGTLLSVIPLLALYAAPKQVNESYALIALTFGIIAVVSLIPARPISELVSLSDGYAAATTNAARSQYLAAGEALLVFFNGTAWLVDIVFSSISGLIISFLMLRGRIFSKATAYPGIIINIAALGFFIPIMGLLSLFLATLGGVLWQFMAGRRLLQLAQAIAAESTAV
jgi:hypothetical protein